MKSDRSESLQSMYSVHITRLVKSIVDLDCDRASRCSGCRNAKVRQKVGRGLSVKGIQDASLLFLFVSSSSLLLHLGVQQEIRDFLVRVVVFEPSPSIRHTFPPSARGRRRDCNFSLRQGAHVGIVKLEPGRRPVSSPDGDGIVPAGCLQTVVVDDCEQRETFPISTSDVSWHEAGKSRLTAEQFVFGAVLSDLGSQRRTHDPLVDGQFRTVGDLLRALLNAADFVVQEAFEVEEEDGRQRVDEDLLRSVLRPHSAGRHEIGQRFWRREVKQGILDAKDVVGLFRVCCGQRVISKERKARQPTPDRLT